MQTEKTKLQDAQLSLWAATNRLLADADEVMRKRDESLRLVTPEPPSDSAAEGVK